MPPTVTYAPLDQVALRLTGDKVRHFANGMFTNNVRDLAIGAQQCTAFTDDRGRLQGLAQLFLEAEDRIQLVLDGLDEDAFASLFRVHLMLEDIEVEALPTRVWFVSSEPSEGWSWRIGTGFGCLAVEPPSGTQVPLAHVEAERIAAGQPRMADASAKQLPHELGLRETHLHFEKGCYLGQEIIHRIDVMGGVRKQLTGLLLDGATGDTLERDGRKVGRVGTRAEHPVHGWIALSVVRNEHREPGTVLGCGEGTATVVSLPMP